MTAVANALLLLLAYAVIAYGLPAIVRLSAQRLFGQLGVAVSVISRAVPLLMVFALVLFINTEMWQVFSGMPDLFLAIVGALFVAVGSLFLIVRLPREVRSSSGRPAKGRSSAPRALQRRAAPVRQPGAADPDRRDRHLAVLHRVRRACRGGAGTGVVGASRTGRRSSPSTCSASPSR